MFAFILLGVLAGLMAWQLEVVSNLFLSPLRDVPGPFFAKITPRWLMLIDLAGNRTSAIHRLHQQYGQSVRVGPREVSYSNQELVKELYGQQTTFRKAPIYDHLSVKPLGIFSMRDRNEHSQRRRLLSHAFSQSNLFETEPLIKQIVQKLISHVEDGLGKPLNMLLLFRLTAFDIVGELFLGQSFGGLDSISCPQFLKDMDYHFLLSGVESSFPWLNELLLFLPLPAVKHFLAARDRIIKYGQTSYEKYISQYGRDSGRKDLLTKILSEKTERTTPLTDRETYTEIANLVFAGTDTTSTTLTYLFWELSKNRDWQRRLREELSAVTYNGKVPAYKDIVDLPILDAVITETLRLHPAAPASLQRETPAGGRTLNGVFIPEKTIVSMQCYTTQRDPTVYPNPDSFMPNRWIGTEAVTESMKSLFLPFSRGTRACLGKNLAMMELKMTTATLVRYYTVDLGPDTTEDSMMMMDHFLAMPRSGKCDLMFSKAG
ncbi:cytochrome P450 [Ilyonectria sp. MPI-CAGE-AT-0026]|nr:cytochrome P450 [Ilyonectria sp. MPI-CAGE-AT-0026]